jgi:iron complex outermembrane recepter protein
MMKKFLLTSVAMVALIGIAPAFAQDAPQEAADEAASSGDIVVTATRSETLLSKTPIAMTAISGEGLRDAGITDSRALADLVPNLQISENGDAARVSIRGVTSTDNTEKGDPSAAFLLDGVYIARPIEVLNSFFDLERIEVLRGPQGTLFGRNTTAGVINVIAARPKAGVFQASVDGSYGSLGTVNATGMINVPVGDTLAIRAAVNYDRQDSPIIQTGGPIIESLDPYRNTLSGRLSFGGELGERLKFVVRGDYTQAKGGVYNLLPLNNFFPDALTPNPTVNPRYTPNSARLQRTLNIPLQFEDSKNNRFWGVAGEFSYDLGGVDLTYLGAYRETHRDDDRDFFVLGFLHTDTFFFGDFKQNSHELRASFGGDGPFKGQVGAYYFDEESTIEANIGLPFSSFVVPGASGFGFPQGPTKSTSKAAFGQFTFDVTDDLHLTGGIRHTKDSKSRVGATIVDFPTLATSFCGALRCVLNENIAARKYSKTTWKVGFDYDAPGLGLIYANVSTGYKAGGFNDGCETGGGVGCSLAATDLYYNPETLTAYEGGFKLKFADNAVRLNGSIFHYDYKGLQLSQICCSPPQTLTKNAAAAKVDGIELEAVLQPSDNDKVDLSFSWLDARYSNFFPDTVNRPTFSFNGRALDHAPKYSAAAGYTHTFNFENGGKIDASVRTRLSAAYFMQDLNNLSQFRQPSFTKTGGTLTYTAPDDRFYIQGFVQNIENEITLAAAASGLAGGVVIEEPRTYGIRAGFKF